MVWRTFKLLLIVQVYVMPHVMMSANSSKFAMSDTVSLALHVYLCQEGLSHSTFGRHGQVVGEVGSRTDTAGTNESEQNWN